jgi:hypothetical protein
MFLLHKYEPAIRNRHRLWTARSLVNCPHLISRLFPRRLKQPKSEATHTNRRAFPPFHLHAFMVCCVDTVSNSPLLLRIYKCYITNVIILPNLIQPPFATTSRIGSIWCPLRMKHSSTTNFSAAKLTSLLSVLHTIVTFPSFAPLHVHSTVFTCRLNKEEFRASQSQKLLNPQKNPPIKHNNLLRKQTVLITSPTKMMKIIFSCNMYFYYPIFLFKCKTFRVHLITQFEIMTCKW